VSIVEGTISESHIHTATGKTLTGLVRSYSNLRIHYGSGAVELYLLLKVDYDAALCQIFQTRTGRCCRILEIFDVVGAINITQAIRARIFCGAFQ
jgi:hypothetical protein